MEDKWPRKGDRLFRSDGADWWSNACLNYLHDHLGSYIVGYKQAGDLLSEYVTEAHRNQDTLVYPIVFLYRQYIELQLKQLIRDGNRLLEVHDDFPKHHDIWRLWKACRKILEEVEPESPKTDFDAVEEGIQQFSQVDPNSMAFRYPMDKDGAPLVNLRHINLRNFSEVVNRVAALLEGASCCISSYLDAKEEMESYYR